MNKKILVFFEKKRTKPHFVQLLHSQRVRLWHLYREMCQKSCKKHRMGCPLSEFIFIFVGSAR